MAVDPSAAQGHSEQPPGPGWPPVMTDEEAKAKLREKVKARRERDAASTPGFPASADKAVADDNSFAA